MDDLLPYWDKFDNRYFRRNPGIGERPINLALVVYDTEQSKPYHLYHWDNEWLPLSRFDDLNTAMMAWEMAYG